MSNPLRDCAFCQKLEVKVLYPDWDLPVQILVRTCCAMGSSDSPICGECHLNLNTKPNGQRWRLRTFLTRHIQEKHDDVPIFDGFEPLESSAVDMDFSDSPYSVVDTKTEEFYELNGITEAVDTKALDRASHRLLDLDGVENHKYFNPKYLAHYIPVPGWTAGPTAVHPLLEKLHSAGIDRNNNMTSYLFLEGQEDVPYVYPALIDQQLTETGLKALLPPDTYLPEELAAQLTQIWNAIIHLLFYGSRLTRENQKSFTNVLRVTQAKTQMFVQLLSSSITKHQETLTLTTQSISLFNNNVPLVSNFSQTLSNSLWICKILMRFFQLFSTFFQYFFNIAY